jgi:hypothetical protein
MKMLALITLTTMSMLTLWFMSIAMGATSVREDQEEPAGRKRKVGGKFTFLAAWMATLSWEENPYLNADDNYDPAPPPERHPDAASYCPKCKGQFRKGFNQCKTCDVALVMFDGSLMES